MEGGTERRIVTVLFADLVGFTSLSESLDPEDAAAVQTAYFDGVRDAIARHGGVLEKFIGDAVMAVFGAPRARDDDAERAVRAGLALVAGVQQLAARLGLDADLDLRVGVNTGEVVQAERRHGDEALVTGDAVNVAARLQAVAQPGDVVVGETTALAAAAAVDLQKQDAVELKGKREAVRLWRVAGLRPEPSRDEAMGALRSPLLGRDEELLTLERMAAEAAAGPLRGTVIAPPGVGKTRLVSELAARLDLPVWVARVRLDLIAPYDAVRRLLSQALAQAGEADIESRLVAAGAPERRAEAIAADVEAVLRPPAGAQDADAARDRDRLFASWIEALDLLAGGPAAWVVEDVHWAGADLLAFLDAAGAAAGHRLVLTTARPSLRDTAAEWVSRGALLDLGRLGETDAHGVVEALVGDALGGELTRRLVAASDGNPLFLEELLRSWVSSGTLVRDGTGWRLTREVADVTLPATVQAIYGTQLDDLPADARGVARRAAVAGRTFPLEGALRLVPEATGGIETLRRRALLSDAAPDPVLGEAVAYRHALLRDAGYASLARAERAGLHARYAEWLQERGGERVGEVAELVGRHLERAAAEAPALAHEVAPGLTRDDARREAAVWFELGAEAALEIAAHETARELLGRALALTPGEAALDAARRRARLGEITASSADMAAGAQELAAAIEAYRPLLAEEGARDGFSRAVASLGWVHNQQVRFDRAAQLADDALAEVGGDDDPAVARLLVLRAVAVNHGTDDLVGPLADGERALAVARRSGDGALEVAALRAVAQVRGSLEDWRELAGAALAAQRWNDAADALRAEAAYLLEEDRDAAEVVLDRTADLCQARGLTEAGAWTDYTRVELGALYGDWEEAVAAARRAVDVGVPNAYHRAVLRTWSALLPLVAARGDRALAAEAEAWMMSFEPPAQASLYALVMIAGRDLHLADAGAREPFVPPVEERLPAFSLAYAMPSWYSGLERVVRAWLEAGEIDAAADAVERLGRTLAEDDDTSDAARAVELLLRARVREAEARRGDAADAARRASVTFEAVGAPWWRAKSLRLLDRVGAAADADRANAAAIERSLAVPVGSTR